MGGIGSALQLLHSLRSLALCTWSTFLERWWRSRGADSLKGRTEFMRKGTIHFFDGDQLAETTLTTITLKSLIPDATVQLLDGQSSVNLSIPELGLSLIGISFGGSGCHDIPTFGSVGISMRSNFNQSRLGRLHSRRMTSIDLRVWINWKSSSEFCENDTHFIAPFRTAPFLACLDGSN